MINLRYHIVSITAVFLALGIGLTLGSSFLDRVTVDNLKDRLDTVQERVERAEGANNDLTARLDSLEERDVNLATEISERILAGQLDAVPVLVVATEGTDDPLVNQIVATLNAASAQVAGTWSLTERWLLDDPEEVTDLATILEVPTEDPSRLRRNAAIRLAELMSDASQDLLPPEPPADPAAEPAAEPAPSEPTEPALVAQLQEAGFIDYRPLAGSGDERVLLPAGGMRLVMVSGAPPETGPAQFATVLLDELVAEGPARVVAAQGEIDLPDVDGEPASEDARRSVFVGPLREGDLTRDRLSTVDDIDTAAGLLALVLAIDDLGAGRLGHYGVASGAARLLPGAEARP